MATAVRKMKQVILNMMPGVLGMMPRSVEGHLRTRVAQFQISAFTPRVVERTFGGRKLKVYLTDRLSRSWYDHDHPELPEIEALRPSRLRPGGKVFNIGAHQGVIAMQLAHEVGPTGHVIVVEPNPHNFATAKRNSELNGLTQMTFVRGAVADRSGMITFGQELNGQIDDGSGAKGRLEVPCLTLDNLAEQYGLPDVVYMDIEGAECLALGAAERVLNAPVDFFIEMHVGCGLEKLGGSVEKVLAHFPKDRFTVLSRTDDDAAFEPMRPSTVTTNRFFLVALSK